LLFGIFNGILCWQIICDSRNSVKISKRNDLMTNTIQVRQRGTLTLPAEIRQKYGIEAGDTFRVVDLDGMFILTPMVPMVPELAREIEKARLEAGLDTAELLLALREERAKYVQETYSDLHSE
jgi:bifunctional DNA-binding transcriptional regulator/antitoxin component of YhaV-PrlF toxin-antitoxin module